MRKAIGQSGDYETVQLKRVNKFKWKNSTGAASKVKKSIFTREEDIFVVTKCVRNNFLDLIYILEISLKKIIIGSMHRKTIRISTTFFRAKNSQCLN